MQRSVAGLPDFLFAPAILHMEHILLKHIAPSEGVGRPKGGLGVVPTRNFTDLLVQLQICNNPQSAWLTCGSGDGRVAQ